MTMVQEVLPARPLPRPVLEDLRRHAWHRYPEAVVIRGFHQRSPTRIPSTLKCKPEAEKRYYPRNHL